METHLFNLKFTAKQLTKQSAKSEKAAKDNKEKCKKAMEKGNMDGARIYAESAIREKSTALNYLRLSSRIDAVASRVDTAIKMNQLTKGMKGVVTSMGSVMSSMNVEKISKVMDQFEKQFEDLDIASQFMENSISSSTAQSMPVSDVDSLMSEVAEANGLEFESQLDELGNPKLKLDAKERSEVKMKPKAEALVMGADLPSAPKSTPGTGRNAPKTGGPPAAGPPTGGATGGGGGGGGMSTGTTGGTNRPAFAGARDDEAALEARLRALMGE